MRGFLRSPSWAAALTAALGIGVIAASCGGSGRPHGLTPGPAGSTTTATTLAPTSTSAVNTGPYQWTRAASPVLAIGGGASTTLSAVLAPAGARPWIVAGTRIAADGATTASVWTSANGVTWSPTALTGPQVDSQAGAAATWRTATLVVGSVGEGANQTAAVWMSSTPGAPFVEVPAADLPAGQSTMTAVSGGGLGLFAAGRAGDQVAMWYSSNGLRWTQLAGAEHVIAGADDPEINALLATSDGVFAAGSQQDGSHTDAALWSSGDGVNWHPVLTAQAAFAAGGDRVITALGAVGSGPIPTGYVAVGGVRVGTTWSPASWISPNGASWSEATSSFQMSGRPQGDSVVRGLSVTSTGDTSAAMVAVGGGTGAQWVWHSTDGIHWIETALPAGAATANGWRATLVAGTLTASVVADGDPGQPHVLAHSASGWSEPSSTPAVFGAVRPTAHPAGLVATAGRLLLAVDVEHPSQAIGPATDTTEVLTSNDSSTWRSDGAGDPFAGNLFAESRVMGVTALSGRVIAVGALVAGGHQRAVSWTSATGATWTAPIGLDRAPVALGDHASATCSRGTTIVAVGANDRPAAARAWVSSDGTHWRSAPVAAPAHPDEAESMLGCVATATGFYSFGLATATNTPGVAAVIAPAYWASTQGSEWTKLGNDPFGNGPPFPLGDLAPSPQAWLASSGPGGGGISVESVGPALARSTDGGATWQRLDTTGAPWTGAAPAQIDRMAWLGTLPVVAGQIDGRLAVWLGTPNV